MDVVEIDEKSEQMFRNSLLEKERSHNTVYAYLNSLTKFKKCKGRNLTKQSLIEFKNLLLEDGYAPQTINCYITGIRQFASFFGHDEINVKKITVPKKLAVENVPTKDEYLQILEHLELIGDMRRYWAIKFLAKTGARGSELLKLKKDCLKSGYQDIWNKGKIRRIYIPKSLAEESNDFFERTEKLLFPNKQNEQMTLRGLEKMISAAGKECGVRKEVCHPHAFRHYFSIRFLENGGELSMLSHLLGHVSVTTTAIYTQKTLKEQMEKIDEISKKW